MMDPFASIGLAANILQFLEFSRKIISGASELYHAIDGATSSNTLLERITKDLDQVCNGLEATASESSGHLQTESEFGFESLIKSCRALGQEFLAALEALKAKGTRRKWSSLRQALRCVWKAKDIERFEKQLDLYRNEISVRLLTTLKVRQDLVLGEQLEVNSKLEGVAKAFDNLAKSHRRLEISTKDQSVELRKTVTGCLTNIFRQHQEECRNDSSDNVQFPPLPSNFPTDLRTLALESTHLQKQINILESLQFEEIAEREDNIKKPHPTTFEWLFEEAKEANDSNEQSNILQWLRSGNRTFWISGKAGSGKSTLMKFFHNHMKTHSALEHWAAGKQLLVANFFFWNAGTRMQKSQQGLLQTLLYHILRQAPGLLEDVCPRRWGQSLRSNKTWKLDEIEEAFVKLKEQSLDQHRFCFFIDGLDEYDGDHFELIQTVNRFTSSNAIKICFSSRPWNVFEEAYGDNDGLKIRLQDLTRGDIRRFAEETLAERNQSLRLKPRGEAYKSLVTDIVDRSDGVFLWVFLVVRSLCRGMTNLDTPVELQERLQELPTELEAFFRHILNSTEKFYQQQAAKLYLICLVAQSRLTAFDLFCFAEKDPDFGVKDDITSIDPSQFHELSQITATRVLARCRDLLEFAGSNLQFLHRTVKDFLETTDISTELKVRAGIEFNPHNFICNSMLLQLRLKARLAKPTMIHFHGFDHSLISFCKHAQCLEERKELNLGLLPELERSTWEFLRKIDAYDHVLCEKQENKMREALYDNVHREGWLADFMAGQGIRSYLTQGIGGTIGVLTSSGLIIQVPPLEVALQFMIYLYRPAEVSRLLDEGADPNETNHRGQSVWESFIYASIEKEINYDSTIETKIIRELLVHGADPSIGGKPECYFRLLEKLTDEDAKSIEDLRQSLLPQRPEQLQAKTKVSTPLSRKRSSSEEYHSRNKRKAHAAGKGQKHTMKQSALSLAERISRPASALER